MREEHGFRILDYKVDNELSAPRRLFQLLRAARAQDGLCALCGGVGRVEHGDLDRGPADLRRGSQARRALRDRAAPGPALGGRRIAAQGGRLRDLRPRQIATSAFRRQGLRAAAPGPGGRAARHRQHGKGRDRSLPHRRPKPARDGEPRRFPQADRHLARPGHREHGRRQGLERLDGRRERAQQGRGDGIPGPQGRRAAQARRLSRHRPPVEGKGVRLGSARRHAARDAMDGRLRPRPDRDVRRRRRPRDRRVAGLRRPARRRRAEARRAQQRGSGDEDDRTGRPGRFRPRPVARQGRLRARAPGRDARRRLQFPQPRAERLRSHRPRRRRPRRAGRARRLPLYRARRLPLGRDRVRDRASARRQGRRHARPAADARGQAAGRRRVQACDSCPTRAWADAPSRFRSCRARRRASGRFEAYADPKGDAIGEVQFLLEDYIPERLDFTLHPAKTFHRSRRAGRALARRALPLWRAGERARRHRRDPPAGGRGRGPCRLPRLCRGPRRRRVHHRREPVHRQGADRRQGPRGPLGRSAGSDRDPPARGEAHRRRRRARRPHGRAHRDAAGAGEGRHGRGQEGLRRVRSAPATRRPSRRSPSRPTARGSRGKGRNGRSIR